MKMKIDVRWATVLVLAGGLILAFKFEGQELPLNPNITQDFVAFFMELAAIALFVERALEVLVTPWREKDAQQKQVQAATAQKVLDAHKDVAKTMTQNADAVQAMAARTTDLQNQVTATGQALADYRSDTQRIAFAASLAVGIVVSLIGFRALNFFVQGGAGSVLYPHHPHQLWAFQIVDVILTGALISGGSDGIHQMVTIFTNFADQTKAKTS